MIVPGVTAPGTAPSMLRNVLPRPTVSQSEYPDAGYIRVTGPKGCQDCGSQAWNADVDSRRNLAGINFASLGRSLAGVRGVGRLGLVTPYDQLPLGARIALGTLQVLSSGASAYHGYRRNKSVGWAVWWGFCGAIFPIITPAVAIAQGFGKRRSGVRGLGRRRRR